MRTASVSWPLRASSQEILKAYWLKQWTVEGIDSA